MASIVTLLSCREGMKVKFVDTESEAATTMVKLIEGGPISLTFDGESSEVDFTEDDLENLVYVQVNDYEELMAEIDHAEQRRFDVMVVDTLDHKHSFAIKKVTGEKTSTGADWNEYPQIYSHEKEVMNVLSKPRCSIISTLDPESGKRDKPKGTQTNIHGYFNVVLDLIQDGDEWGHKIRNYVGESAWIGKKHPGIERQLVNEFDTRRIE